MYGLLGRGNISHMPKIDSIKEVVNSFSKFFNSKVQTIRDGLDQLAAASDYVVENIQTAPLKHHLTSFDEASENAIQHVIMRSPSETRGLDRPHSNPNFQRKY